MNRAVITGPATHSLVAVAGVVDLLVAQRSRPARVAGAGEAAMPGRVAVSLDAGAPLTGLAARLHPVAQPLSGGAPCGLRAVGPRPQSGPQVLQLPVDVQVAEAAVEAGAVVSARAMLQGQEAPGARGPFWHTWRKEGLRRATSVHQEGTNAYSHHKRVD